ncbi:hypothetical protein IAQ61_000516 [Plenodomus lingam]|uniref:Uncharacterized protein n=1 Tax=Leptosphaeria maculans (strain JN3 / isolate v23.1.3 / race Av1-4-5-6-7-8) TaxID=985895 RepID=E5A6Y8_LEPMJ|nr:hypothetical protein LEMA_P086220.1 [Plenodomus lingam JN3]KAH9880227.1 hypothetical protein IAQ61_000516 [Plenodomus lingam]CBX99383.1 hypothetical protein LEMA_P086220.1 [Plenodomus lingam JN3]
MDFASDDLIRQVSNTLNGLTNPPITETTVERVLNKVSHAMQTSPWSFAHTSTTPEKRTRKLVQDTLDNDITRNSLHGGLRHARHTFLVICAYAKISLSTSLAEQMLKFVNAKKLDIELYEEERYMQEWKLGLRALSKLSLVDQHALGNNVFDPWLPSPPLFPLVLAAPPSSSPPHNPFDTYPHRNRSHASPLVLATPSHLRPCSLGHRRNHGLQLALPRFANPGWSSPVLSPGPYYDEVGQLQWRQEEMNWKLEGIDQKLDRLAGW